MQKKEEQKVVFVSLSIHTNLEHEENTQKKKKKTQINLHKITDLMKHLRKDLKATHNWDRLFVMDWKLNWPTDII